MFLQIFILRFAELLTPRICNKNHIFSTPQIVTAEQAFTIVTIPNGEIPAHKLAIKTTFFLLPK